MRHILGFADLSIIQRQFDLPAPFLSGRSIDNSHFPTASLTQQGNGIRTNKPCWTTTSSISSRFVDYSPFSLSSNRPNDCQDASIFASTSTLLPPLICGTATFNDQYNPIPMPFRLPPSSTKPFSRRPCLRYFALLWPCRGPSRCGLGYPFVHENFPRRDYFLLTKVGRITGDEFDYSASWVRHSVQRSLERLHTNYLDVVYCHDVEFVSPEEVLTAVTELRRIRDETGIIKYIGISGYPVTTLCDLAEMILDETREPLDIVMSYANFTLQNTRLASVALPRLKAAGIKVVPKCIRPGHGSAAAKGCSHRWKRRLSPFAKRATSSDSSC